VGSTSCEDMIQRRT